MKTEAGPQNYQFRHQERISMDSYQGIARDTMQLNDPIADGFMRVADMRRDIVVEQKTQQRTYNYEQLGPVKVAKILEIPRIGRGEEGVLRTRKDGDIWFVEIDDQKLWKEVAEERGTLEQREEQFTARFRDEVLKGVSKSLFEEKLFNSGVYSPASLVGIVSLLASYPLPALYEAYTISHGTHTQELDLSSLVYIATAHVGLNMVSWCAAIINDKLGRPSDLLPIKWNRVLPDYQEPWVRHKLPEFLMPPIPVDRLVRGIVYLKSHGSDLIQSRPR